jgi:hypothetical protein
VIPLLGLGLSRLGEYSCERHGGWLSPRGARGLVLLASGRYIGTDVDLDELVRQGRQLRGSGSASRSCGDRTPFTVHRLERLYRMGLFRADVHDVRLHV